MQEEVSNEKIIYTYIGFDDGLETAYYIYDPATDKHHRVSKEKYDKVMKNARPLERYEHD